MPTLILSSRYTEDSQILWTAAQEMGWDVHRLVGWRLPKEKLNDPVLYVESLFASMLAEQLGKTLVEPSIDWMAKLPEKFSKRKIVLLSVEQARRLLETRKASKSGPLFVKPPNDKSFLAKVYEELPSYLEDNALVLVQDVVEWEKEFRCFALNKKVRASSVYWRDGQLQKNEGWYSAPQEREEARAFAESVLAEVDAPNAIAIDVGVIKDEGWAVIELNAAWGSGVYGCNPKEVLEVLRESIR